MLVYLKQKAQIWWPTFSRLFPFTWRYWPLFLGGLFFTLLSGALDGVIVWLLKPIIDKGFVSPDPSFIRWLPLLILGMGLLRSTFSMGSRYCVARVGTSVVRDLRIRVFQHLLKLPMAYYDQTSSGKLIALFLYNITQLAFTCTNTISAAVREGAALVGLLAVMLTLSWSLTGLFFLSAPLIYWIYRYACRRLAKLSEGQQQVMAESAEHIEESVGGVAVMRAFGMQQREMQTMHQYLNQSLVQTLKSTVTESFGTFMVQMLMIIPLALVLYLVTSKHFAISAGTFTAFVSAVLSLRMPVQRLTGMVSSIQPGLAAARSTFALLDHEHEVDLGSCEASNLLGAIRFDNVHFRYQTADSCVLQDFCLEVHPGQTVALVGLSGAGKSTVFKLLQRFYEPQQGVIRLDDVPIEKFSLDSLRQQIAVVNQDVVIFSRSIRDNIAYGRTAVDEEAIIEVAKRAHAWEFIKDLPEGLDTMLGAKGLTLSGGQKQRIAIARAMLCARPVLLLDEATSALDAESEKWVQEGLHSLMATATTLVIAHRLSTVRHADLILVMDHGRVVEQGSHDELLKMNGAYARLHALQFNSEICQS